jgi:hypothetical protein
MTSITLPNGRRKRRGPGPEERLHLDVARFLDLALPAPVFWTSIDHGAGKLSNARGRDGEGARRAFGPAGHPDLQAERCGTVHGDRHRVEGPEGLAERCPEGHAGRDDGGRRAVPSRRAPSITFRTS